MNRTVPAVLRVALGTWLVLCPPVRAQAPSFPSQVEAVTVDVVVLDKKGQPVPGLTREDFLVSEDGAPQTITTFDAVVVPEVPKPEAVRRPVVSTNVVPAARRGRTFILFFDDVHLTVFQAQRAKLRADRRPEAEMDALFREQRAWEETLLGGMKYSQRTGAFEGASYEARGLYRPEADCIMFTRDRVGFCRVCRRAISRIVDLYSR